MIRKRSCKTYEEQKEKAIQLFNNGRGIINSCERAFDSLEEVVENWHKSTALRSYSKKEIKRLYRNDLIFLESAAQYGHVGAQIFVICLHASGSFLANQSSGRKFTNLYKGDVKELIGLSAKDACDLALSHEWDVDPYSPTENTSAETAAHCSAVQEKVIEDVVTTTEEKKTQQILKKTDNASRSLPEPDSPYARVFGIYAASTLGLSDNEKLIVQKMVEAYNNASQFDVRPANGDDQDLEYHYMDLWFAYSNPDIFEEEAKEAQWHKDHIREQYAMLLAAKYGYEKATKKTGLDEETIRSLIEKNFGVSL